MRPNLLKKNIPRLEVFSLVGRFRLELFHGLITREIGMIDPSDECSQCRIVVEPTQFLSDLNDFFNLFRPGLGLVVTQDKRYDPERRSCKQKKSQS